jgi:endonuclease-3
MMPTLNLLTPNVKIIWTLDVAEFYLFWYLQPIMKQHTISYWDSLFETIKETVAPNNSALPSVSAIAYDKPSPFRVLFATIISLRTRDEVTLESSNRLFSVADNPEAIDALDVETIERLIYPAGFYKTKAKNMKKIASILLESYEGEVPHTQEELLALPGVGIKTANLTLNLGFNIEAICVDTHVHRISNRMGWIETKSPEESEIALQLVMPRHHWIPLNELLVLFGQKVCTPLSPHCSTCPFNLTCEKVGVKKSR